MANPAPAKNRPHSIAHKVARYSISRHYCTASSLRSLAKQYRTAASYNSIALQHGAEISHSILASSITQQDTAERSLSLFVVLHSRCC